jgi:hypothetical protein
MLPPLRLGFELITLLFDQFELNGNSETKHSTATTAEHSHSSTAHDSEKATRLYGWTLLAFAAPSYPDHSPLSLDLPTSLEAWISQAEPTILRCISDANDDHIQTNPIDDYFPRLRDG